jgi:hypothetical protein
MYLQSEISPFPDELVEMLSDEQYLINAPACCSRINDCREFSVDH